MYASNSGLPADAQAPANPAAIAATAWLMMVAAATALVLLPQIAMWKALAGEPRPPDETPAATNQLNEHSFRSASGFAVAAISVQTRS